MNEALIVDFVDGDGTQRDLLGGKGAGLAEMTRIGLRVPPGFTVTTAACRYTMDNGEPPEELQAEVEAAMKRLEERTGRTFGHGPSPLLVSVRSGARISMPGMMDTVLNLGVCRSSLDELIEWSANPHFAFDAYRRFLQMYGEVVLGLDDGPFERTLTDLRKAAGVENDAALSADDLARAATSFEKLIHDAGFQIPEDPYEQLHTAISAVFGSWNNPRARRYRKINRIPDDIGTAANVQMMVFGDLGEDSGTGVCFTRDPATGKKIPFGDYLPNAQGEDVVAGIRNTLTLDDLAERHPEIHTELLEIMDTLERHTTDMCDIEFTVERDTLWILQTRAGKRTGAAAVRIAVDMVTEGLIDASTAVRRVDPAALEQLERPRIPEDVTATPIAEGVAASPGAAQGEAIFDADRAVDAAARGESVLLIRPETTPDDIHGMDAAVGILTSQGGKTSHAAVVARGMGKPAVTGAAAVVVDLDARRATAAGVTISEGDPVTIDGTTGRVFSGIIDLVEPDEIDELEQLLDWADDIRTLGVLANADTPSDARKARQAGAQGIGLARTEHMFLGERLQTVRTIILSDDSDERDRAFQELRRVPTDDFEGLLEAMDGLPVIVRLLDPPLHEFLPSLLDLEHQMVDRAKRGKSARDLEAMASRVAVWEEDNPMLGLRGVRLGLIVEHLYAMQVEAATAAVRRRLEAGGNPRLEIMIPLVSTAEELRRMREMIEGIVGASDGDLDIPIGTMIELPRAALTAGEIAAVADFFSFGTNDLTQMTFGLSRDDAEGLFLRQYLEQGILTFDPFQTLDIEGVGRLIRLAIEEGREANPNLIAGICGEHGGDPASIAFCRQIGLDYVSASPPRLSAARLAAAQAEPAVVREETGG